MGIKIKLGERTAVVPPGEYRAKVIEINEGSYIGKRKTLELVFEIADGAHQGVKLRGFVNAHYEAFTSHTKLYKWLSVVGGNGDMDPGHETDLDIFYDKILTVQVETKESKKTKNPFSNVIDILGVKFEL